MKKRDSAPRLEGPPSYDNWKAFLRGDPSYAAYEFPIYTDAYLTGQPDVELGPYTFFNVLSLSPDQATVCQRGVLRFEFCIRYPDPDLSKTDIGYYHGGFASDEIVALASLLTGARLSAGGESRRFYPGGDPRGYPSGSYYRPPPTLTLASRAHILPTKIGQHSLMPVVGMGDYAKISGADAIALVRSARMYQDALWIAEAQPNLAWLLLVGAVETAAAHRSTAGTASPLERVRDTNTRVAELLDVVADGNVRDALAREFARLSGATAKFKTFLLAFLPDPPVVRPKWSQVDWSSEHLAKAFGVIYGHRSRALHTGIPFPASMCDPPEMRGESTAAEKPSGMSYLGGTWIEQDAPMCLHIFEHVVRGALLQWWRSLAG